MTRKLFAIASSLLMFAGLISVPVTANSGNKLTTSLQAQLDTVAPSEKIDVIVTTAVDPSELQDDLAGMQITQTVRMKSHRKGQGPPRRQSLPSPIRATADYYGNPATCVRLAMTLLS